MAGHARSLAMVRDAVVVAVIAVVVFQALRKWCGDRYLVPTGSMEPVLHGDPEHGDVVFVDKLASASARRRHDLVVVQHPEDPGQQMVKRIAARGDDLPGGCWIDIREGDVWLGESRDRVVRETKDPLEARTQRVPWADLPGSRASDGYVVLRTADGAPATGPWRLPALRSTETEARRTFAADVRRAAWRNRGRRAPPEGFLGTAKPVDAGHLDATGARPATGGDVLVSDAGMRVACQRLDGELLATVETRHEALTFHWQPATGRVVAWRDGEDVASSLLPASPQPRSIEFGLLDDRAWFCVDDDRARLFVVPRRPEWNSRGHEPAAGPGTTLHVGVLAAGGNGALDVAAVHVFHDVFAYRDRILSVRDDPNSWPRFVPSGQWFLLGDSAFDSRDSRQLGPVQASSFLGVPRLVLGPWSRRRWVTP